MHRGAVRASAVLQKQEKEQTTLYYSASLSLSSLSSSYPLFLFFCEALSHPWIRHHCSLVRACTCKRTRRCARAYYPSTVRERETFGSFASPRGSLALPSLLRFTSSLYQFVQCSFYLCLLHAPSRAYRNVRLALARASRCSRLRRTYATPTVIKYPSVLVTRTHRLVARLRRFHRAIDVPPRDPRRRRATTWLLHVCT